MSKDYDPLRPYKFAKIYSAKGNVLKSWYCYYFYKKPGTDTFKMFKKTLGINRIKDGKKRMTAARSIQNVINDMLAKGFSPFGKEKPTETIEACIEKYLSDHGSKLRPRTVTSMRSTLKLLKDKFGKLHLSEITGAQLKNYLTEVSRLRKWQNKTYNNTLTFWKAFFNYYRRQEAIEKNPCDSIPFLKEYPTDFARPPTESEFEEIVNHLYCNDRPLFLYAMIVYYQGFRISEIGKLQRNSIEFTGEHPFFRLPAKNQKDNQDVVQYVSPHLLAYFYEAEFDKLPPEYFLFSSDLLPGKNEMKKIKDIVEQRWRKIVKADVDKKGLGIKVNLYSMKHKQATELGGKVSIEEISKFFRHSDTDTTKNYMRKYKPVVSYSFYENQRKLPLKKENTSAKIVKIK